MGPVHQHYHTSLLEWGCGHLNQVECTTILMWSVIYDNIYNKNYIFIRQDRLPNHGKCVRLIDWSASLRRYYEGHLRNPASSHMGLKQTEEHFVYVACLMYRLLGTERLILSLCAVEPHKNSKRVIFTKYPFKVPEYYIIEVLILDLIGGYLLSNFHILKVVSM